MKKQERLSQRHDNSIFYIVSGKAGQKNCGTRCSVEVCIDDCIIGYSYKRLCEDAAALSFLISESGAKKIYIKSRRAYELALSLLCASAMGLPLTVLSADISSYTIIDIISEENNGFFICSHSSDIDAQRLEVNAYMYTDEFAAKISGARSSMKDFHPLHSGQEFSVTFLSENASYCYSESSVLFSARSFAEMSAIVSTDRTLCDIDPRSPEGFICGLVACLVTGSTVTFCSEDYSFIKCASLSHPTRIFCTRGASVLAAAVLGSGSPITSPVPFKKHKPSDTLFTKHAISRQRRLAASNLMRLGGDIRQVTVLGNCSIYTAGTLADNGILSSSLLSSPGCPFLALRLCFSKSPWIPPKGSIIDICDVQKSGIGKITVSSAAICLMSHEPILHGNIPGSFRLDHLDGISLVTDLFGYICPDGSFFVEKRLDPPSFAEKSSNNYKILL